MSDAPIAEAREYVEFQRAMRQRKEALHLSNATVDALASTHDGYAGKVLSDPPSKNMGITSFGLILQALGLKILIVEDENQMRKLATRMVHRVQAQVRKPPGDSVAAYKRKFALKGVRARLAATTPEQRIAIARTAACARWHGKGNGKTNGYT